MHERANHDRLCTSCHYFRDGGCRHGRFEEQHGLDGHGGCGLYERIAPMLAFFMRFG